MPYYCCNLCNISTKLKYDFNRHLNTKKHADNIAENNYFVINETMTQKDPKKTQKDPKRPTKIWKKIMNATIVIQNLQLLRIRDDTRFIGAK